jgi:uncharacterized damage-inducible protein DinB
MIAQVAEAPAALRGAVAGLDDGQLDTPYRDGGWTVRQVAHHVPDSHMNAYVRFKLALTEDVPAVKTYEEKLWAETPEVRSTPIAASLDLLDALHVRWVRLLREMSPADYARPFRHPEWGRPRLDQVLAQYAWHGRHHTAHVTELRRRNGW